MSEAAAPGFHLVSRIGISSSRRSSFNRGVNIKQQQQLLKSTKLPTYKITASAAGSKRDGSQEQQPGGSIRKRSRSSRRLIKISTGEGRWNKRYSRHYSFSLWDLQLEDLVQDDDATVSVTLSVDKHASFGFSVDGDIVISFTRKCSNCSSPYSTQIDTKVNVWVLPSSRERHEKGSIGVPLPVIGGEDDPSVIYVKPGHEADLDSLVQDSVRLALSVKDTSDTCSAKCEQMQPEFHHIGKRNEVGVDKRWSRLLQLKKQISSVNDKPK